MQSTIINKDDFLKMLIFHITVNESGELSLMSVRVYYVKIYFDVIGNGTVFFLEVQ